MMFAVDSAPVWVIGGDANGADDLVLHGIVDAALLGGDAVVIAERSTQQVIRVDLGSGAVRRWGRAGDGPEEFRGLAQVYDAGDGRVGAFDRVRNRYVEIDENGTFVEDMQVPAVNQLGTNYLERAGTGALYLAAVTSFPVNPAPGARRGGGAVLRLGEPVDTVTLIRGNAVFFEQDAMGGVLFGGTTVVAPAPSGLWVGDTELQEVVLWGGDRIEKIVRWAAAEPRVLTEERKAEFWRHLEAGLPADQQPVLDDARRRMFFADTIPAFGSIETAQYGTLWVGSFVPPEPFLLEEAPPAQNWLVLDTESAAAGTVTTPEGFRLLVVGTDFVVGVHMDELGVETLRRYDLIARA
jgi:hypothetical protein